MRELCRRYSSLIEQAKQGNIDSLCIKLDIDHALKHKLTYEEELCIREYLIKGTEEKEVAKMIGKTTRTVRNRIRKGLDKLTNYVNSEGGE